MPHSTQAISDDSPTAHWPKLSIITPSFNQGEFLEQCIESVLSQNYPNLEYLILDGGSTDQSPQIIDRRRQHLTWAISEKDGGQSDAINKGISRATGDLVAWLNADDFYLPGALHTIAQTYRRQPGGSFYFGDGLRVDRQGKSIAGFFPGGRVCFNRPALLMGLNFILQPSTFMDRKMLLQAGMLDGSLHWGMDSDLWMRLSALAPPVPIVAQLSASREYADTKTSTGLFVRIEELRQIAEKHAGAPITPGVLCYFLDTLHKLTRERPDLYPAAYRADIERFWAATAALMGQFGAGTDGFPLHNE
ncbi:MAG: glycosyltransferase [Phycisphaerales bacterium]|nr:glycosyltransferase [Phycisphaerales bacterium]